MLNPLPILLTCVTAIFATFAPLPVASKTLTATETKVQLQSVTDASSQIVPRKLNLMDHHKNARVYLPLWDTRTLKMTVKWDAGYDMPSTPKTLSLFGATGDVYWQTHLRPEPAHPTSAKLAAVSLPASALVMSLGLFSLWMAANSRKTQTLRRRYN